ncbi:hypothetical protein F2Q68_00020685 [Brassica cretica]|uniref:Uncharacterized protein n=1 Tax=Brassica cretica TaxID=69181 RepID=A0A8S9FYJ8_BRACR|nr:hypothetical protein F2Q68_00020685 [Brassica cretica]
MSSGGIVRDLEYNPVPVKKPKKSSRRIDDPVFIAACHCGAEYETGYSVSIETHTTTSIDSAHQKSIDSLKEESVDSCPSDWENDYFNPTMATHTRDTMHTEEYDEDYEEERAIEYIAILDEEDRPLHHSSWKRNAPSIDINVSTVHDKGDYSIGSWANDHHHESYAVKTAVHEPGADELCEGFTYEELLNMQRRDEADQHQAEASGERTRFSHTSTEPIARQSTTNIHHRSTSVRNHHPLDPDGYARAIGGHALQVSREHIADILQMANGADKLFMQQCNSPAHQQWVTNEFYDTAGGIDNCLKQKYRHPTRPSIDVDEEKNEYGVYRDDQGHARDVDGRIIKVFKDDIRSVSERASRDEHNYICLPKHASSFTQTKLVPYIYTKDEVNEMFYGVCGAQEKNEGDLQMKFDGVYYLLNDSISWLTTCMEEMRQDIVKTQTQCAAEATAPSSTNRHHSTSIDDEPHHSHPMKCQPDSYTRADIDQLVERIYKTLETTEESLDRRCDDIYFPMDLTMIQSSSTRGINIDRQTQQQIDRQSQTNIGRRSYKPRQASTKGEIRHVRYTQPWRVELS